MVLYLTDFSIDHVWSGYHNRVLDLIKAIVTYGAH